MTTITAILFRSQGNWVLTPKVSIGVPRDFQTAAAARKWAKKHNVRVIRTPRCDD